VSVRLVAPWRDRIDVRHHHADRRLRPDGAQARVRSPVVGSSRAATPWSARGADAV